MSKIRFFILTVSFFFIGTVIYGQTAKDNLTLSLDNVPLSKALTEIEKTSGCTFFYDSDQFDLNMLISMKVSDAPIVEVLDLLSSKTGLIYEIRNRQIILTSPVSDTPKKYRIVGTVRDVYEDPLVGVAVMVEGDVNLGTTTDMSGCYSIDIEDVRPVSLIFSSLGYVDKKVAVKSGQVRADVYLNEDATMLDEIVVVGYGTQKKVNLTGAVSQVSSDEIQDRASVSIAHMLQGSVPGLNVNTGSGRPGNGAGINIRGINSINGGQPLVLIDGAEGDLNTVNPNDVESVSVVKDASSSAIYGARASFGVILVTTKQGSKADGKTKVKYSGRFGWGAPTTSTDYEDRGYYSVYLNDLFYKSYAGVNYSRYTSEDMEQLWLRRNDKVEDPSRPWTIIDQRGGHDTYVYYANTDWYHELFRDIHPQMSHNLSFSGGTDRVKYYLSGGYYSEEGIFKKHPDRFQKINMRSRISFDVNDWINVSNNTSYYRSSYFYPGPGGVNTAFSISTVHALASFPAHNPDGTSICQNAFTNYNMMDGLTTILDKDLHSNKDITDSFSTMTELTLRPLDKLEIKGNFTYMFNSVRYTNRQVNTTYSPAPGQIAVLNNKRCQDKLKESSQTHLYMQANVYATYADTFADSHNFKAMLGFNWETKHLKDVSSIGYDLLSESLNDLNLVGQSADGEKRMEVSGGQNEYALAGVFARINYDYKERYLVELSGRYDGTSRFGSGHRWGFFPSASLGWRISEENFFRPVKDWFSNLKIRYSFGQLGNQQVGYYDYVRKINISTQDYLFGGDKPTAATISAPVASDLSWEVAQHQNVGVDMAFLNNRLGFTGEFYIRDTKNMLTEGIALPGTYGAPSPKMNSADLRTMGYELSFSWRDMFTLAGKPFSYNVSFNFSDYTTTITRFDNPEKTFAKKYYEGMKWGEIWGYRTDGYFATDEEAANWKVDQTAVNSIINASAGAENGLRAGDIKFVDLNGDDKISIGQNTVDNAGDREIIGNRQPRYNYGITLGFNWFNIDFSMFFQGIGHIDWYPPANAMLFWGPYARPYSTYIPKDFHEKIWSPENPDAYFPRPRGYTALQGNNRELTAVNDRYLQNIGYCRLKNLTVGYTIPKDWTRKIGIDLVRIYFTGENLATWSGIKSDYIDPEMAQNGGQLRVYPWQKTCMFGLDISF